MQDLKIPNVTITPQMIAAGFDALRAQGTTASRLIRHPLEQHFYAI